MKYNGRKGVEGYGPLFNDCRVIRESRKEGGVRRQGIGGGLPKLKGGVAAQFP